MSDLIDREKLLNSIEAFCEWCPDHDWCPTCETNDCIQEIKNAPTVDAEPVRHGHWTWFYTSKQELSNGSTEYTPIFLCSECGHRYESYRRYDEPHEEDADYPKYCENCGARMDGGAE